MIFIKLLFYSIFLQVIDTRASINLYFTDIENGEENNLALQHDCLYAVSRYSAQQLYIFQLNIPFCMSELSQKFQILKSDFSSNLTFSELAKKNITTEQLYLWSAPIDLIEYYQDYLNGNDSSLAKYVFYNCTWPKFGPLCQYEFDISYDFHRTVSDYIYGNRIPLEPFNNVWPCYIHLSCIRKPGMRCLDWTDICDGKVDCLNGGVDEEYCWQLEVNECQNDEYKCYNGLCLLKYFVEETKLDLSICIHKNNKYATSILRNTCGLGGLIDLTCNEDICFDTFLTSSCSKNYFSFIPLYSIRNKNISDVCWFAFQCLTNILPIECRLNRTQSDYISIIEVHCPDFTFFPSVPILFDDIYITYIKNQSRNVINNTYLELYLCSKNSLYENYFFNHKKFIFNDLICYRNISWIFNRTYNSIRDIFGYQYGAIHSYNPFWIYSPQICERSNMYQCQNSTKCISINRLNDGIDDCMYLDDEDENIIRKQTLTEHYKQTHYQCPTSKKYIPTWAMENGICDCGYGEYQMCEDEDLISFKRVLVVIFSLVCDGFLQSTPIFIDGKMQSDETECENWPCNNYYTRCNGYWNCINGEDELNCETFSEIDCSVNHHICNSIDDGKSICLSLEKVNDGISDCHGSIDESKLCKRDKPPEFVGQFHCRNDSVNRCIFLDQICDKKKDCLYGDDEQFCNQNFHQLIPYKTTQFQFNDDEILDSYKSRCNQGFSLRVWLDKDEKHLKRVCFCPPYFYGNECQYQNQRVSLYVKFETFYNSFRIIFQIIVSLIDDSDERTIHSYEQFTLIRTPQCTTTFYYLMNLMYSTRPKSLMKNYSIHIDIYEKISLIYRGSFFIPIEFSFLPVHRLAKIFLIPRNNRSIKYCSNRQCNYHGKCIQYLNQSKEKLFCQCERGWRGKSCSIPYHCSCSSDSLCLGLSAFNRSVCICPVNRMGPRCLLMDRSCQIEGRFSCPNESQCIPHHEVSRSRMPYTCRCHKGFSGQFCEQTNHKIMLSFGNEVNVGSMIHIHLFRILYRFRSDRTTISKTISKQENSTIIYWEHMFHLVIVQTRLPEKYYFVAMTLKDQTAQVITKMITSSDRCLHMNEFLPQTIYNLHFLRRIKYYHFVCQTYSSNVSCFYDNTHFCVCDYFNQQRHAYCFTYERNQTNVAKNTIQCYSGGEPFEDDWICPTRAWCICSPCFYGAQCEFTTSGFGLSLDSILSYHIQPSVKLTYQPALVQVATALSIIFIIFGFLNSFLSVITFKNKTVREVGCGLYLLTSSIITFFTMFIFGFKVCILLLTQMSVVENQILSIVQCYSSDFLLRIFFYTDQWLIVCVTIERSLCVIQGTRFNKKSSKQRAKLIIFVLFIFNIATSIHDPIYRQSILGESSYENDDDNYIQRIWCIIDFKSTRLSTYNNAMHTFQFFVPFLLNFVSAVILVTRKSRQRANTQMDENFFQILRKQLREHQHLFIAPIVLVILAIPRLIITYTTKCMESQNDAWLYLVAYFISFMPSMLTFIIFVTPSKFYKKEFQTTIQQFRRNIQRRLHIISFIS